MINKYSILNGRKYFSLDGSRDYLVFQPLSCYFTSKNDKIHLWRSNGISKESIKTPSTTDNSVDLETVYNYAQGEEKFKKFV